MCLNAHSNASTAATIANECYMCVPLLVTCVHITCDSINKQLMTNLTIVCPVKMEYG